MLIKKMTLAAAAAALTISPAAAYAAQTDMVRASAPVEAESNLEGNGIILALLGAAAVIAAIVIIADGDDDEPVSA